MLDETVITETPPLYSCYGHVGPQMCIPISGNNVRRIIHGVLNIQTDAMALLITKTWNQATYQSFLKMIRSQWCGWQIILFED